MIDYSKLPEYRPGTRPVGVESLPAWVDRELRRLQAIITAQNEALRDLNSRITP